MSVRLHAVALASTLIALSFASPRIATASDDSATRITGRWHGTSICTKIPGNEACHDEEVAYEFGEPSQSDGHVHLKAYKRVEGEWGLMGELDFTRVSTGAWSCEFKSPRAHGIWSYRVDGKKLSGTLILLPDKSVARNVEATRE